MSYVTQGTIQVEIISETDIEMKINPVPDYTVKHEKQDYILFIHDDIRNAKLSEKTQPFTIKQPPFIQHLIAAAVKQIKIEIKIKDLPRSSPKPISIEIESIRIPPTS